MRAQPQHGETISRSGDTAPAIALTIAGSDSSGGAGIQADLKAFSALGVYGASVITAITAQNTRAVTAIHDVPLDVVEAQIAAVLDDLNVGAIKIGMLSSPRIVRCVAEALAGYDGPIVLDPVIVSKSGAKLLRDDAIEALVSTLLPRATLITPNLPEAGALLGEPAGIRRRGGPRAGRAPCPSRPRRSDEGRSRGRCDLYRFPRPARWWPGPLHRAARRDPQHPRHGVLPVLGHHRRSGQGACNGGCGPRGP